MKILFVSELLFASPQGSKHLASMHLNSLQALFGVNSVEVAYIGLDNYEGTNGEISSCESKVYEFTPILGKVHSLVNSLLGRPYFMDGKIFDFIVRLAAKERYDVVWFDHSVYGALIKKIKQAKNNTKVISFYHSIVFQREATHLRRFGGFSHFVISLLGIIRNESLTAKYSDLNFVLTQRDNNLLQFIYNCAPATVLPIYFKDKGSDYVVRKKQSDSTTILFVGGWYWPNVEGIRWFVDEIMPLLPHDFKLVIVGKGMEALLDEVAYADNSQIEVAGTVDSIDEYYSSADVAIGPILSGDGMKTKTGEALMFGVPFVGTTEALIGYEATGFLSVDSASDFATEVKRVVMEKVEPETLRCIYKNNYSAEKCEQAIKDQVRMLLN